MRYARQGSFGKNAVTYLHNMCYSDWSNWRPIPDGEKLPRLIWMHLANPDTSTTYVKVASFTDGVAISPPLPRFGFPEHNRPL